MEIPRLLRKSGKVENAEPAAAEEPAGLPDDYSGPIEIGALGLRFLSLTDVPEHLKKYAIPVRQTNDPENS